jgi:ubiquinone/menaquinone biosynthesis C-methylase UbiE
MPGVVKQRGNPRSTEEYNPHDYWTRVAQEIETRSTDTVLAGDATPLDRYTRAMFLMKFLDRISIKGRTVLEVGCGPGGNLVRLAKAQPKKLVGSDISEVMIELARKNTCDLEGVDLVHIDGIHLPFNDRSFDVTFTVTVLIHNHDSMLTKLLPEICRVTDDRLYLFESTSKVKREWFSYVSRPVSEYAALCATYGFELLETEILRVFVSYTAVTFLNRAFKLLNRIFGRNRKEGEPITKLHTLLIEAVLIITKPFDNKLIPREGLTKMVFQRKS